MKWNEPPKHRRVPREDEWAWLLAMLMCGVILALVVLLRI